MAIKKYHVSKNISPISDFTNTLTDTSTTLRIFFRLYNGSTIISDTPRSIQATGRQPLISYNVSSPITRIYIKHDGIRQDIPIVDINVNYPNGQFCFAADFDGIDPTVAGGIRLSKIMLNEGSTAEPFEPYDPEVWHTTPYRKYETATDTITTLPKSIIGDGQNVSAYTIKGNMQQSGTLTPSSPIYPTECGERTENLFDGTLETGYFYNTDFDLTATDNPVFKSLKVYLPAGVYTLKWSVHVRAVREVNNGVLIQNPFENSDTLVFQVNSDGYFGISFRNLSSTQWDNSATVMLNTGSTALPYEPYGYKLPITLGGNNYPVYLSEPIRKINTYVDSVPSTGTASRLIKKLVLTGEEDWGEAARYGGYRFAFKIQSALQSDTTVGAKSYCSHLGLVGQGETYIKNQAYAISATADLLMTLNETTRLADWKQWLADEYTNGTPVTIWYVLATPTTESYTAPTLPTSGTAETFDVDTTLKPSEVSLTYHGWHEHSDTKYTT